MICVTKNAQVTVIVKPMEIHVSSVVGGWVMVRFAATRLEEFAVPLGGRSWWGKKGNHNQTAKKKNEFDDSFNATLIYDDLEDFLNATSF